MTVTVVEITVLLVEISLKKVWNGSDMGGGEMALNSNGNE